VYTFAKIRALVGESEGALDHLEHLLSIPSECSGNPLKLDPHWDVLRNHPRFQTLIDQPDRVF
jgi:hypothetical protein